MVPVIMYWPSGTAVRLRNVVSRASRFTLFIQLARLNQTANVPIDCLSRHSKGPSDVRPRGGTVSEIAIPASIALRCPSLAGCRVYPVKGDHPRIACRAFSCSVSRSA